MDLATAHRMVQAAVEHATSRDDRAAGIAAERVARATRRARLTNRLLLSGTLLALAAAIAAAVSVWRSRRATAIVAGDLGVGATVPKPAGTIPTTVMTGRQIYERNKTALYVFGYLDRDAVGGFCSGFAIAPDVVATNAHCIAVARQKGYKNLVVIQNEGGGRVRFPVTAMSPHARYSGGTEGADSPDVGLLRVKGPMPLAVTLASDAELWALGTGDDCFVLGFPGRVIDPGSPAATFLAGHVGRVMDFGERSVTPDKAVVVQHDAVTRGGNSGSPVFDQYGHVVAIHAAHLDDEGDVEIGGQKTPVVGSSTFRVAMRIDLLRQVPPP